MANRGQALTGKRRSTPKTTIVNADDSMKVMFKKVGNGHAFPFIWADEVTMAQGETEITVATGVKFHGYDLATYGNVTATPLSNPGGYVWVEKNTTTNTVKVVCSSAAGAGGVKYDVKIILGVDFDKTIVESWKCKGNTGSMPCLP